MSEFSITAQTSHQQEQVIESQINNHLKIFNVVIHRTCLAQTWKLFDILRVFAMDFSHVQLAMLGGLDSPDGTVNRQLDGTEREVSVKVGLC